MKTSKAFYRFLTSLDPDLGLAKGYSVIYPYSDPGVKRVLRVFCDTFYSDDVDRILMLGINPGRFGAGITGIPFTDPYSLEMDCGVSNDFEKRRELSSSFIYEMINAFGGPKLFYKRVLLSSVCPLGFLQGTKNFNYYDSPKLIDKTSELIKNSMKQHVKMHVRRDKVIILGKKNASFFWGMDSFSKLFNEVIVLDHPRFVMQYRSKLKSDYLKEYIQVISS
ncbi:MAG: uracil-DNA glycosylase family protein [Bacteroidota bacterium]